MRGREWSLEDHARLKKIYPFYRNKELARLFGRSIASINTQAMLLGLKKNNIDSKRITASLDVCAGTSTEKLEEKGVAAVAALEKRCSELVEVLRKARNMLAEDPNETDALFDLLCIAIDKYKRD